MGDLWPAKRSRSTVVETDDSSVGRMRTVAMVTKPNESCLSFLTHGGWCSFAEHRNSNANVGSMNQSEVVATVSGTETVQLAHGTPVVQSDSVRKLDSAVDGGKELFDIDMQESDDTPLAEYPKVIQHHGIPNRDEVLDAGSLFMEVEPANTGQQINTNNSLATEKYGLERQDPGVAAPVLEPAKPVSSKHVPQNPAVRKDLALSPLHPPAVPTAQCQPSEVHIRHSQPLESRRVCRSWLTHGGDTTWSECRVQI